MSGYSHLTAEERDRIADLKAAGLSLRAIARALGRAASTISRELRRNALDSGAYRPHVADGVVPAAPSAPGGPGDGREARDLRHGPAGRRLDAGTDRRAAAARDRDRPARRLRGDALRLGLPCRPEGGTALALPDPPACPPQEAPRSGVSRHDRREGPYFSAIWRR